MARNENVLVLKDFETPSLPGAHYCLICLTGPKKGDTYFLRGNRLVMGRSESVDIPIYDNKCSREHAELTRVGGSFVITDLGSQNGVLINDQKITQKTLDDGDKIIVGATVYKFNRVEVEEPRTPEIKLIENQGDGDLEGDKPKKSNKIIFLVIIGMVFVLFLPADDSGSAKRVKKTSSNSSKDGDYEFSKALKKKKKSESRELKSDLDAFLQRGMRELREKNYFRALEEFDAARQIGESNTVDHYRNLAKQRLDQEIKANFISATKDKQALRYEKAIVAYCNIVRLLQDYPDDEDYKKSENNIRDLEILLGKEKNDIKCF